MTRARVTGSSPTVHLPSSPCAHGAGHEKRAGKCEPAGEEHAASASIPGSPGGTVASPTCADEISRWTGRS